VKRFPKHAVGFQTSSLGFPPFKRPSSMKRFLHSAEPHWVRNLGPQ